MIKHIVLFKFKPEATQQQRDEIIEAMKQLPEAIPQIKKWSCGTKGIVGTDSRDFGLIAEFEKLEDLTQGYQPHPAHQAFVAKIREGNVVDLSAQASLNFEE